MKSQREQMQEPYKEKKSQCENKEIFFCFSFPLTHIFLVSSVSD